MCEGGRVSEQSRSPGHRKPRLDQGSHEVFPKIASDPNRKRNFDLNFNLLRKKDKCPCETNYYTAGQKKLYTHLQEMNSLADFLGNDMVNSNQCTAGCDDIKSSIFGQSLDGYLSTSF